MTQVRYKYSNADQTVVQDREQNRSIPVTHSFFKEVQDWVAEGNEIEPYKTQTELVKEAKEAAYKALTDVRDEALKSLTHDFGDGRVIQVRPPQFADDESNIRNAIERMIRLGLESQIWYMIDNTPHEVTPEELADALISAQDQGAAIWDTFFSSLQS